MFPDPQHIRIQHRTRLLIAGMIGLLMALFVTVWIWVPTLGLLTLYTQFSPLVRAAILIKLLSPLLSFTVVGGWVLVFLWGAEWVLYPRESKAVSTHMNVANGHQEEQRSNRLESLIPRWHARRSDTREEQTGSEKLLTTSSLVQCDPTLAWQHITLPITPLPATNPMWDVRADQKRDERGDQDKKEERNLERIIITQSEQKILSPTGTSFLLPQEEQEKTYITPEELPTMLSLQPPTRQSEQQKPVTLTLLKQLRAWVRADDGTTLEVKLRGGENSIRLLILAYVAWRQGKPVDRDKLLTHIIARGKRRDMNTDQLGEVFDAAKRYLRQDLDRAVNDLEKAGHPLETEVDFFQSEPGFYSLHPSCQVIDLGEIEQTYQTLFLARKEGLLDAKIDGSLPPWVLAACQKLLTEYPGDFLQALLEKCPEEFGSWVKEPFTFYRDCHLDALLILANYESALGRNFCADDVSHEYNEEQRRRHRARAAQLFYEYVMTGINSIWDRKLTFAYRAGKDGERVIRAARAMRRCVVELGKLGQPDLIDQAYLPFKDRMSKLSEGTWKPDSETERDVADAKKTTSAYRFSSHMATTRSGNLQEAEDKVKEEVRPSL